MESILRIGLGFIPGAGPILAFIPPGGLKVIALVLLLAGGVVYVDRHAAQRERGKCDAAALAARVAELKVQLKNANDRAESSARVVAELQAVDVTNIEQIETLRRAVEAAKLQSTKPGAKRDANAFYDDRCNLTERGARGMRGR